MYCMLDPKRTQYFFNASTGKKRYFTNINSGNEKLVYFFLEKYFVKLIECIWFYEGRGDRGVEFAA